MSRQSRFALLVCAVSTLSAAGPEAAFSRANGALARLPLRFEVNQGQCDPAVRYAARAAGYTLLLKAHGASFSVAGSEQVNISLLNSNPAPRIEPLDRLSARTDYFLGARRDWHADVASYARVRYHAVYPGIDLVYYGNQNQLEYDFVLQPGADPNAIRLEFRGPGRLSITPEGDLALETQGGRIVQKRPVIFQEDSGASRPHAIAGRYRLLARNVAGIRVDGYDRRQPLVIDPVITYATYMGGPGQDRITAVKIGANGLLYITGWTTTGDLTATDGAYQSATGGLTDAFVAIVDTTAAGAYALTYFTYLGGTNLEQPLAMDVDSAGIVYLTGTTTSTNFPTAGAAAQTTGAATTVDAFVVKLDPSQSGTAALVYSSYLGGATGDETGRGIVAGRDGMIYVIGTTNSSDFPVTASAYAAVKFGDPPDAFLTKIDPNSSALVYSTYLGGEDVDDGRAIALGADGLVYFAGSTASLEFPLAALTFGPAPFGGGDIFIGVMDMSKAGPDSLVYCSYFGGLGVDEVRKIALDAKGNVMLTGYTLSPDFPVTGNAAQPLYSGNGDAFVSVVNPRNPANFLVYSTFLGGTGGDVAYDVAADSAGSIYVTGYTLSPDFPSTQNAPQPLWGQGINGFVTKLQPGVGGTAGLQYSTYIGATAITVSTCLSVAPDGTAYVGGYSSGGLAVTGNAAQGGFGGGSGDGFFLVLSNGSGGQTPGTANGGANVRRRPGPRGWKR